MRAAGGVRGLAVVLGSGFFFVHQPPRVPKLEGASCRNAYLKLYGRRSIDVRILFGYKDARPARFVGDRYERALFVADLLKPCAPGQIACGFDALAHEMPTSLRAKSRAPTACPHGPCA